MAATRNNYGAHTIAILTALEERGTCTARQVTDATGLESTTPPASTCAAALFAAW